MVFMLLWFLIVFVLFYIDFDDILFLKRLKSKKAKQWHNKFRDSLIKLEKNGWNLFDD